MEVFVTGVNSRVYSSIALHGAMCICNGDEFVDRCLVEIRVVSGTRSVSVNIF